MKRKVFLGGTCNGDDWRDKLIPMLRVPYFNPIVEDWTEDCIAKEEQEKEESSVELYTFTKNHKGLYSVAELFYSACKKPYKCTIMCILIDGMDEGQKRSINQVAKLFNKCNNNLHIFYNLTDVANFINKHYEI